MHPTKYTSLIHSGAPTCGSNETWYEIGNAWLIITNVIFHFQFIVLGENRITFAAQPTKNEGGEKLLEESLKALQKENASFYQCILSLEKNWRKLFFAE